MADLRAQVVREFEQVLLIASDLTGLPSRWNGTLELVPAAEFKGKKGFSCSVQIDAGLATRPIRKESAMSTDLEVAREILTEQILDATTLPEIHAARQALRDWIRAHPEDEGMSDAFEQLSLLEDAARAAAKRDRQSGPTTR